MNSTFMRLRKNRRRCRRGLANSVIPGVQPFGLNPKPEKHDEHGVGQRRFPTSALKMAARRGGNRRIEQGDATGAAEALREFNVFHQCDVGETAEPVGKMSAPNEDGLIAVKRTEGTIVPAFERLEPAPAWMSFVEMSMKGATDDVRARRERSEGLRVRTCL